MSEDARVPRAEEFLVPEGVYAGFGDGTFCALDADASALAGRMLAAFAAESQDAVITISEVTEDQYREMLMEFASVRVTYPYGIPAGELLERQGAPVLTGIDQVGQASGVILTSAALDSLFLEGGGSCWRLESDSDSDFAAPLLAGIEPQQPALYTAGSMLGGSNMALLPLSAPEGLAENDWIGEHAGDAERAREALAEAIFGANFDFVRRITDSFGNVTYMYGYGERTLNCLADGSFEYRTETAGGNDPGFFASLEAASAFVARSGGWGEDGSNVRYVLGEATQTGAARTKVYAFDFLELVDGVRICSEDGGAIQVRVQGGEVCYYRRSAVKGEAAYQKPQQAAEIANVLAGNCHLIHSMDSGSVLAESSDEEFAYVADHFRQAQIGYVRGADSLQPAWIITMEGGMRFFFDLYDAAPLGFTRE
ncbi:MAG: hypothetical protein K5981_09480 [Clostridia bacterium]|nr:hypothetical protein [Clostridia bacterium]